MRFLDYLKRFTFVPNDFYEHLKGLEDAAAGDVKLQILPAMTGAGTPPAAQALEIAPFEVAAGDNPVAPVKVPVKMQLVNAKGDVLTWYNGKILVDIPISTVAGTVAINDGDAGAANTDGQINLEFQNGVGEFVIVMGGKWIADETVKVTADDNNVGILGTSIEINNHYLVKIVTPQAG